MWLIANTLHKPLDRSLIYVADYPHTAAYCCRKQMQIDSFMELPKDKRPPRSIWNEPEELEHWFDRVLRNEPTELEFIIDEVEE